MNYKKLGICACLALSLCACAKPDPGKALSIAWNSDIAVVKDVITNANLQNSDGKKIEIRDEDFKEDHHSIMLEKKGVSLDDGCFNLVDDVISYHVSANYDDNMQIINTHETYSFEREKESPEEYNRMMKAFNALTKSYLDSGAKPLGTYSVPGIDSKYHLYQSKSGNIMRLHHVYLEGEQPAYIIYVDKFNPRYSEEDVRNENYIEHYVFENSGANFEV